MTERLAYNTRLHSDITSQESIIALGSLAVEAGQKRPMETRVWPYRLVLRREKNGEVKVTSPGMGDKDVREYYSVETKQDRQETKAALRIRKALIQQPVGTTVVWLSGPNDQYPEGRVDIGHSLWDGETKLMQSYGTPVPFSQSELVKIANNLLDESRLNAESFKSVDEFRDKVFILSPIKNRDTWKVVKEKLRLGKIWKTIESKEAEKRKQRALRDAQMGINSLPPTRRMHHIHEGAHLERFMNRRGWGITGSSCGRLNSDLVTHNHIEFGPKVMIRSESKTEAVYVKECGVCHKHIGQYMIPGKDRCPHCASLYPKIC